MKLTRSALTWSKARRVPGPRTPATHYLLAEAARDADPLHGALHDPVTGLPERALLLDRIALALARARRKDEDVALLVLAVEGLDGHRQDQADRLLRDVAERVSRAVRDTDSVARFGAAELAVLCEGVADEDTLMFVAGRIASNLAAPYPLRSGPVDLDVAMDVVLVSGETPPLAMLDLADQALAGTRERRGRA